MKHINLRLFSSFFKIGAFTFGGGWAMISLLEEDIVNKHKWLEKEEFIDNLAIAQSLPGIMAVNVAIAVGYKLNKIWGSIFAVLGTILPSFMIILAIAMFLTPDTIKNNETLTRIFKGIRPAVVALILAGVHHRKIRKNIVEERLDPDCNLTANLVEHSGCIQSYSLHPYRRTVRIFHLFKKFPHRG